MARIKAKTQQNLVETIKAAGCNFSQISKATGISLASIHDYSNGIGEVSTANLEKLAEYFGVDIEYLRAEGIYKNLSGTNRLDVARRFHENAKEKELFEKFVAKRMAQIAFGDTRSNEAFVDYSTRIEQLRIEQQAEKETLFKAVEDAFKSVPEAFKKELILKLAGTIK